MMLVLLLTLCFGALIVAAALEHWSGLASFLLYAVVLVASAGVALGVDFLAWIEGDLRKLAHRLEEGQSR